MKKQKSRQYKIAIRRVSERQKKLNKEYRKTCHLVDKRTIAEHGYFRCFFCRKPISGSADHHHVAGKQGTSDNGLPLYIDPQGIVPGHPKCHRRETGGYHSMTLTKIRKQVYFDELLELIKNVNHKKYTDWMIKLSNYEPKSDPLEGEY